MLSKQAKTFVHAADKRHGSPGATGGPTRSRAPGRTAGPMTAGRWEELMRQPTRRMVGAHTRGWEGRKRRAPHGPPLKDHDKPTHMCTHSPHALSNNLRLRISFAHMQHPYAHPRASKSRVPALWYHRSDERPRRLQAHAGRSLSCRGILLLHQQETPFSSP